MQRVVGRTMERRTKPRSRRQRWTPSLVWIAAGAAPNRESGSVSDRRFDAAGRTTAPGPTAGFRRLGVDWMQRQLRTALTLLVVAVVPPSRGDGPPTKRAFPGESWEKRDPAALGMDAEAVDRIAEILAGRGCIVKDGYVVKAWGPQDEKGDWASSAKPVLSTLLFFALHEGLVSDVDAKVGDFGWELAEKDRDMTLRQLANMTSGYARPEPPGRAWAYNDYGIQLYQKTLFDRIFKGDPDAVAAERLAPLRLQDGLAFDPARRRLSASVRDFARIAWFWLNRGAWNGVPILPSAMFDEYCRPHVPADLPLSQGRSDDDYLRIGTYGGGSNHFSKAGPGIYGFNWWFNARVGGDPLRIAWPDGPPDAFLSIGAGGNCSAILPSLGVVLVAASANWGKHNPGDRDAPTNRILAMLAAAARPQGAPAEPRPQAAVDGELKKWHAVSLTFQGPHTSETADPNPFRCYRMTVVFVRRMRSVAVPGYFAADGNAAETGASEGDRWRVDFLPDEEGPWSYFASFVRGDDVAVELDPNAGERCAFDGAAGGFVVGPTDKPPPDLRGRGLLRDVGGRYFQFAETGEPFLKMGTDSPENFLAYADFDGATPTHAYAPHLADWKDGDPTWSGGKGKGIVGALNYLASKGVNSVYFLTMNVKGDGKDVWPWIGASERRRFDVSKLAQWDVVFSHMDRLGVAMHVVQQEQENDQLLDKGELGLERKLYYRELVARFAHHPAVVWNLGEENTNTTEQQKQFADYIRALDPWGHPIVVHTFPNQYEKVYGPLLGDARFSGASLQVSKIQNVPRVASEWVRRSGESGRKWAVFLDEIGPPSTGVAPDSVDPDHDEVRKHALWGSLTAGGAGVEWYFGYDHPHSDLDCEDFRSRERMWDQTRFAIDFFRKHVDVRALEPVDGVVSLKNARCMARIGRTYVVYIESGGPLTLTLPAGKYQVEWYDPRTGGDLLAGDVSTAIGPGDCPLGAPPREPEKDWVVLVRSMGKNDPR
jgi:CubicO group peptidase (beta-lactamase class C family)